MLFSSIFVTISLMIGCLFNKNECKTNDNGTSFLIKSLSIKDGTIFINTIDGTLHAVNKQTGVIKWSLRGDDVILNTNSQHDARPHFLTDPRDGSLYVFNQKDGIRKFPYTIPELVSSAPLKSSDGYLYTGDKKDEWIAVDAGTGTKLDTLASENFPSKLTNQDENVLFFGRTEYKISMFDATTRKKKLSLTYYDYSAYVSSNETLDEKNFQFFSSSQSQNDHKELLNYPYYHFTSSSNGLLITIDRLTGDIVWQIRFEYPIVAIYQYNQDLLHKIDFAIFSLEALTNLAQESWKYKDLFKEYSSAKEALAKKILTPTLYIGHINNRFYALPAFVLNSQIGVISDTKLIEDQSNQPSSVTPQTTLNETSLVEIGHHKLPEKYKPDYLNSNIGLIYTDKNDEVKFLFTHEKPTCPAHDKKQPSRKTDSYSQNKYLWSFAAILITLIGKRVYDKLKRRAISVIEIISQPNSLSRQSSEPASTSVLHTSKSCPEIRDGLIKIGKILYDPKKKLGHGCDGTFVYKGFFENRPVAVKRLLPECYTLADREVDLLRDADQHSNVIRYFCTESDSQFRYIAIELCQATLQDYVNRFDEFKDKIKLLDVLEQASKGLAHLHSLDIVHRDIKPHNVLLSCANSKGEIVAMISDFGLCKRLDIGHTSFSKKSGATGTEGWIAPELLDEDISIPKRITKAIDIFSLGCVYYYVLTSGSHPFGESILRRQMNIMENLFTLEKLNKLKSDSYMQRILIEKMISSEPKKRPLANDILKHPLFWSKTKQLQFLQDVSDRIEKLDSSDQIIVSLELNSNTIIKNNWKTHIGHELQDDLKKFRSYNGVLLRDLLRAIRNKKHHYRELTNEVKKSLGDLPDGFISYFTTRFPKLILHVYDAMVCCKHEPILDTYY